MSVFCQNFLIFGSLSSPTDYFTISARISVVGCVKSILRTRYYGLPKAVYLWESTPVYRLLRYIQATVQKRLRSCIRWRQDQEENRGNTQQYNNQINNYFVDNIIHFVIACVKPNQTQRIINHFFQNGRLLSKLIYFLRNIFFLLHNTL